jgi:glycerate kinase
MKIVIAPDSFKGTLNSTEVAEIIGNSFVSVFKQNKIDLNLELIPIADGGEGTSITLAKNLDGQIFETDVTGPEFDKVSAKYAIINGKTAIIEVAETSGLTQCKKFDTKFATTYGLGELIIEVMNRGVKDIVICLGGSATTDGGCGMAAALGVDFLMIDKKKSYPTGSTLRDIVKIDLKNLDSRISKTNFKVMCDVQNPLFGKSGAAYVYGPQKGASDQDIIDLDMGLKNLSKVLSETYGADYSSFAGAGAAGGLGAACKAFLNAEIASGIDTVLDLVAYDNKIKDADLIITGEGRLDEQSFMGKVISGIIKRSQSKPIYIIAGDNKCDRDCLPDPIVKIFAITDYYGIEEALAKPFLGLRKASEECAYYIIKTK